MARIYDNIDLRFKEGLTSLITSSNNVKRVDFCVGYFNLRGWNLVMDHIDTLPGDYVEENDGRAFRVCRLLIGMHRPPEELIRQLYSGEEFICDGQYVRSQKLKIAREFKKQVQLGRPKAEDEQTLRRLAQQLRDKKVVVKLYLAEPLHAKLYLAHRPADDFAPIVGLMGSSNLTYSGLEGNGELNAEFTERDHCNKLNNWFCNRWDDLHSIDITNELIEVIDNSWAGEDTKPPYYIYLKAAYHLSEDARNGIKEFALSPEFSRELFDFQQTAVKIAAKHLRNEKRRGAMIGDVVGLGKTITACAIAKVYETAFAASTLVICPANLQEMWKKYARKYDLKLEVWSMARKIDAENARAYRLIIIDESHNLRNGASGSRYKNIKELIDRQESAVLLLSATPYNKDFSDLANQLRLFLADDQDLGIRPEAYIRKLGGERQFLQTHSETFIRSIAAFEKSDCVEDWNELMKLFLVRRTRTFIKNNYTKTDEESGRCYLQFADGTRSYFPERKPKALKFRTEPGDQYSRLYSAQMLELMMSLSLPRYGLTTYVSEEKAKDAVAFDKQILENLSRAGKRQMGFCKSTFFKRIDSCGFSFLLTLSRHILRNMVYIYALDNNLPLPIGDENQLPDDFIDDDDINSGILHSDFATELLHGKLPKIATDLSEYMKRAERYYTSIEQGNNVSFIDGKYFKRTLKQHLKKDCETILDMIKLCGEWKPQTDQKLNLLHEMLTTTHASDKVVIFTQYSDTAHYISSQLKARGLQQVAVVTGGCGNPTHEVEIFSPISNGNPSLAPSDQHRVLIATDVLSEGQNLQDSHVIVNFDLPWAIIRLIQRAGRVDRIGQKAEEILCYSFFPAEGVEEVISLRTRLNNRINQNANIIGSDEVFFEGNEQNLRDMFNEKAGALNDDDDADVDLSSQAFQIWKNATDANPALKEIIPRLENMIYSTKAVDSPEKAGVVTYARTYNDFDILTWQAPDGTVLSHSQKEILKAMECSIDTPAIAPIANHHELVCSAVQQVANDTANPTTAGILGNRFSTRHRLVTLLEHYNRQDTSLIFSAEDKEEVKLAIDDLYNYPLIETAKIFFGQMLRNNQSIDEIVGEVIKLRKANAFCRLPAEENPNRDPSIVCSLGMSYNPNNSIEL